MSDKEDAEMFRWLMARAQVEDRDGGWVGFWRLPFIDKYSGSTYGGDKPYDHGDLRKSIRAQMKKESK